MSSVRNEGMSARPDVSVVVASFNERDAIERCLVSLERQETSKSFEVVVIDSSTDGTDALARRFPFVRLRHFPERKYCGDARNEGLALTRGDIIAFLDADCFVEKGWIEAIARAHQSPYLAVGGVIENGMPESLLAWAYYFCEFNLWLPRPNSCEIPQMAGCGLSIKRCAFDQYGPFLGGTYSSDTAFQWRMAKDGHRVLFVPGIRVFHTVRHSLGAFLRHVVEHRRGFATVTAREKRFSTGKRVAAALATGVLPLLLFPVIALRVVRSRVYVRQFVLSSAVVLLAVMARAWGEFLGYATGRPAPAPGKAAARGRWTISSATSGRVSDPSLPNRRSE
jgi:glycosyltransferase involved in cell wall biosynthesis